MKPPEPRMRTYRAPGEPSPAARMAGLVIALVVMGCAMAIGIALTIWIVLHL